MCADSNRLYSSPVGELELQRFPLRNKELLFAWGAADTLMLKHALQSQSERNTTSTDATETLVVNDNFGALCIGLQKALSTKLSLYCDSSLAISAVSHNVSLNNCAAPTLIPGHQALSASHCEQMNTVYLKVPKSLSLLKWQLEQIRAHCPIGTSIIAGGMVKHLSKGVFKTFEQCFGSVHTSLAEKKARLIFSTVQQNLAAEDDAYYLDASELSLKLCNRAGVYSRNSLDRGSRLFIKQFSKLPEARNIIDLGCGNGLLGIMAQRRHTAAQIHFTDVSYLAVDSARRNFEKHHPEKQASFTVAHSLEQVGCKADLILCNPPFHQGHLVDDQIAQIMISESKNQLEQGGQFWLVGNRHLNYHIAMMRVFGNVKNIGQDAKFVVLASHR